MVDDEGTLTTTDVKAKFLNGKPFAIEARFNMRSAFEWDRFIRFMDRWVAGQGAWGGGGLPAWLPPAVAAALRLATAPGPRPAHRGGEVAGGRGAAGGCPAAWRGALEGGPCWPRRSPRCWLCCLQVL